MPDVHGTEAGERLESHGAGGNNLYGEGGDDYLLVSGPSSFLWPSSFPVVGSLYGGAGNDILSVVGNGSGALSGGDGDDHIVNGGGAELGNPQAIAFYMNQIVSQMVVDGGAGHDTYYITLAPSNDYQATNRQVVIDISDPTAVSQILYGGAVFGTITGVEALWIVTSELVDTLTGGAGNDVLIGGGGEDVLNGGAGDDILGGSTRLR